MGNRSYLLLPGRWLENFGYPLYLIYWPGFKKKDNVNMKKKKKRYPPFVMLSNKMIDSKAWQELSCYARTVYIEIKRRYNGKNDSNLSYTYREASKLMQRRTFTKALRELVNNGLIDIIRSGGLYRKINKFGLSDRWKSYGQENFKIGKVKVPDKDF